MAQIYERGTGLLAPWYMRLRAAEEWNRSLRYGRPLSLLILQPQSEEDGERLNTWLMFERRSSDLAARNSQGVYFLLLPEADQVAASEVAKRALEAFWGMPISSVELTADKEGLHSLLRGLS